MSMIFFNAEKLAQKLSKNEVTNREQYCYLAGDYLMSLVVGYSGLVMVNAGWSWLKGYEFFSLFTIFLAGFYSIYALAREQKRDMFISDFICLSFPVANTLYVIVFGTLWGISLFLFDDVINLLYRIDYKMAVSMESHVFELMIFLSQTIFNAAFFRWIFCLLRKEISQR